MGIENRGKDLDTDREKARRIRPEIVRDAASRALFEGLVQKLKSQDTDLRDQTGNPVNLGAAEDLGMRIDRDGDIVLSQRLPDSEVEHIEISPAERQAELFKKIGGEKILKFVERMKDPKKKDEYLDELAKKQMSYQEQLEEAEDAARNEKGAKKAALEKKIADLRGKRDGYGTVIAAIEQGTADIKRTEFKAKKVLEQEITIPEEITKEVFGALPENLQKQYKDALGDAIDAGEKIIEEYAAVLEADDVTPEEKKEAQTRIREEKTEIETKKNLLEKIG